MKGHTMPHPIRFIIEDHSTKAKTLVVIRSTLTGAHLALTHTGAYNANEEIVRQLGVHPARIITYTMPAKERRKVGEYWPHVCHDYPHALADSLRSTFLTDILQPV